MAGFEDLIRATLAKQANPDKQRRASIYASSRQALERMLSQNTVLDETARELQRMRLERAIETIEADYEPPPPPAQPTAPVVEAPPPPATPSPPPLTANRAPEPPQAAPPVSASAARAEPSVEAPASPPGLTPAPRPRMKPQEQPEATPPLSAARDDAPVHIPDSPPEVYEGDALQERRPYARLLLWAIIIAGVGTTIWWAVTFGPELLKAQIDGSVSNPPQRIEDGSFQPEDQVAWIGVFDPATDAQAMEPGDQGRAELLQAGPATVARIASNAGDGSNAVRVAVPPGVMRSLRGKAATFELVIAGVDGGTQQFAVRCEFGAMGDCGRKRFEAAPDPQPYIFDLLLNDAGLADGETAWLAINTDVGAEGKALHLHTIRVRPSS